MFRVFSNLQMTLNTSKTASQPNADDWSDIQEFRHFPILASTRKSFRQMLSKTSLSFDGLAEIAECDPAICLHMLLRIAKRNPASLQQISSAAGCISLLGMEEVVRLVKQLPVLSESAKTRSERNYVASLHTAALAGSLAGQWAKFKPGLNQHQAQWAAMLASSPFWPWHLIQVEASQHCLRLLSQGKDFSLALETSFSKLNKTQYSRWKALATTHALPQICVSLWQNTVWPTAKSWKTLRQMPLVHIDGQREFKLQCQQSEMLIYCANMVALQYRIGAYRRKTQRWTTLTAHLLNQEPELIHQQAIEQSLVLARKGMLLTSINSLLAPIQSAIHYYPPIHCEQEKITLKMERDNPISAPPKSVPDAPLKQEQRSIDQKKLNTLLKQLSDSPESFGDWHHLMRSVLKGITEGIGLTHAYIMVQNKSANAVKVYYQQGLAETDPLCQLGIELDKTSVFKKMLEKPASLMITDQNRKKMLRGISPAQQNVLPQQFMMMSLFSNQRPIGIIFADLGNAHQNPPVQPSEYMAFKTLCMAASKSLGKLAKATKNKSAHNKTKLNQRRA